MITPALLGVLAGGRQQLPILLDLRFEDTLGSSSPADSSPYARVLSSGVGTVNNTQTKCGNSVFGVTTGYRLRYTPAVFPVFETSPFTIQFYFYNSGTTNGVLVARIKDQFQTDGWRLRFEGGSSLIGIQVAIANSFVYTKWWNVTVPIGSWTHIAFTWNGVDEYRLYINNVEQTTIDSQSGTVQMRISSPEPDLSFGYETKSGSTLETKGYIDNLQVIGKLLEADELMVGCPT